MIVPLELIKLALRAVMNAHPWPAIDDQALPKLNSCDVSPCIRMYLYM